MTRFNMIAAVGALLSFMVLRTLVAAAGVTHLGAGFAVAIFSVFAYFWIDDYQRKRSEKKLNVNPKARALKQKRRSGK
ncbi:MAG: hypothetical protein ACREX4_21720 [Gammaproteobacteria bacterium]